MVSSQGYTWRVAPELPELRIAIVGAGKMARLHLQTLKAMPGVRLVGICNRSSMAGQSLVREFGIDGVYQNLTRMLEETAPDAVFVAVSHAANFEVASILLETGIPCLLEKPAGYSSEETNLLADMAEAHGSLNIVGVNRRFYSVINQALLAILQQGPVRGILVEAHEPLLEYRSRQQFDDWLYNSWMKANTIHAIDLLRMIGGDVVRVQALQRSIDEPFGDNFSAAIEFESGMLGTFIAHWNSARGFGLKIFGEGVTAELWPLEQGFILYDTGHRIKLRPDWADTHFKPGLYAQNAAFLQAVCDRIPIPYPASDLQDQVKTMQLIEQIQGRTQNLKSVQRLIPEGNRAFIQR